MSIVQLPSRILDTGLKPTLVKVSGGLGEGLVKKGGRKVLSRQLILIIRVTRFGAKENITDKGEDSFNSYEEIRRTMASEPLLLRLVPAPAPFPPHLLTPHRSRPPLALREETIAERPLIPGVYTRICKSA